MILIIRPLARVHLHLPRHIHAIQLIPRQMFHAVDILLADLPAFSSVVCVQPDEGGRDGEEDEPVAGGEFGTAEPGFGDAGVAEDGVDA